MPPRTKGGRLKELLVKKISYVKRPANRRDFALTKSQDDDVKPNTQKGETMPPEVRAKLLELLKSRTGRDEILKSLGDEFQLEDAVKSQVEGIVDIHFDLSKSGDGDSPAKLPTEPPAEPKAKDDSPADPTSAPAPDPASKSGDSAAELAELKKGLDEQKARADALEAQLQKSAENAQFDEALAWVKKNAQFIQQSHEDAAKQIIALEKSVGKEAAESLKQTFAASSAALENAAMFSEVGSGRTGNTSVIPGGEAISKIQKGISELKKSADNVSAEDEVEIFHEVMKDMGPAYFEQYRRDQLRRSGVSQEE